MKFRFIVLFNVILFCANAQLMDGSDGTFTYADTLRGALRPERTCFDVNYYDLRLKINFEEKTIQGSNEIHFTVISDFKVIQIDLFENMSLDSILFKGEKLVFNRKFNAAFVDFPVLQKKNGQSYMTVYYHGKPIIGENPPWDGGFTWKKDEEGQPWLGVSCEGIGASLWWPNKDHLSDEPDSIRVTCDIPKNLKFVGNGVLEVDEIIGE